MKAFLKFLSTLNKLVCATFLTLAYYSLFFFLISNVSFLITLPVFAISYLITESLYLAAKRYYQPFFFDSEENSFAIRSGSNDRYYFEIAFVVLMFSVILFISAYIPFISTSLFTEFNYENIQVNFFTTALYIFLSYTAALIGGYLLVINKIGIRNFDEKLSFTFNGYFLLFCTAISFILFLWYFIRSANLLL